MSLESPNLMAGQEAGVKRERFLSSEELPRVGRRRLLSKSYSPDRFRPAMQLPEGLERPHCAVSA